MLTNYLEGYSPRLTQKRKKTPEQIELRRQNRLKGREERIKNRKLNKGIVSSSGNNCPKCNNPMERRKRTKPVDKPFYYTEWDYCIGCKHIQHYDDFKCGFWKENEQNMKFLKSI